MNECTFSTRATLSLTPIVTNCLVCAYLFGMLEGTCFTLLPRNDGGLQLHIRGLGLATTTQTL